ncbi:MAG: GNAT family N-acetyltransferase [Desulfobacterota bacterium]|nr:GNAT family N-acetyltransferase [Thermodesulfobacteriota bacterium]
MKNFEFTIRPAVIEDAEAIYDLLNKIGTEENTYFILESEERSGEQIKGLIRRQVYNRSLILVAETSQELVGVLGLIGGIFNRISHVIEVGMAIKREFRKAGIGSTLLQEGISWARKRGYHRLELGVLATNQQAIFLYKKFGFQEEGIRKDRYRIADKWVDEILMAKLL